MKNVKILSLIAIGVLVPSVSHAYVDPGSGSVIVTTLLGIAAAVSYTSRKYFYKIKRRLLGGKIENDACTSDNTDSEK